MVACARLRIPACPGFQPIGIVQRFAVQSILAPVRIVAEIHPRHAVLHTLAAHCARLSFQDHRAEPMPLSFSDACKCSKCVFRLYYGPSIRRVPRQSAAAHPVVVIGHELQNFIPVIAVVLIETGSHIFVDTRYSSVMRSGAGKIMKIIPSQCRSSNNPDFRAIVGPHSCR